MAMPVCEARRPMRTPDCHLRFTACVWCLVCKVEPSVYVLYPTDIDVFRKMGTHLTDIEMLQLAEIYKDYDCLWNVTHGLYKDREARQKAYKQILKKLNITGLTIKDIPKKIKNLRSSYYQELKRIRNSIESGADEDSVYKPKVSWFPIADGFLSAFRNERELHKKNQIKELEITKDDDVVHKEIARIDKIAETLSSSNGSDKDEYDSFGQYIAMTLRNMPQEYSIIAKTELQKTLSEIQFRLIRRNSTSIAGLSPYCNVATGDDHNSGCLTPSSDSWLSTVKIEFDA